MFLKVSLQDIKDFFKTERAILLLCMSIALIFWLFVQLSQTQKTKLKVPLIINVPKGLILNEKPPSHIFVTLKSNGWNLFYRSFRKHPKQLVWSISKDEIVSYQDIKNKIEEKLSDKIEIENIAPNKLNLRLEKLLQKQVAIAINADIQPVSQFQLSNEIQLLPNQITITGPESTIKKIEKIKTEKINIDNLRQNKYGEIKLLTEENQQVKFFPHKVNYMMTVEQFSEKMMVVPIHIKADSSVNIRLTPQMAKVSFTIGLSKFDNIKPSDIQLFVDATSVDLDTEKQLLIGIKSYPEGLKNIKIEPKKIDFVILTKGRKNTTENE